MSEEQLRRIWDLLDGGLEALERLEEYEVHEDNGYLFSAIKAVRDKVEDLIDGEIS